MAGLEGFDECCFVHDGAARGVDYYDAGFHFGEFGGADYVAGFGLVEISCRNKKRR